VTSAVQPPDKVLVVGATGMLGRPVVERLSADGSGVRVLARDPESARSLLGKGVEYVGGAVEDGASLGRALEGCRAVHVSLKAGRSPGTQSASSTKARRGSPRPWRGLGSSGSPTCRGATSAPSTPGIARARRPSSAPSARSRRAAFRSRSSSPPTSWRRSLSMFKDRSAWFSADSLTRCGWSPRTTMRGWSQRRSGRLSRPVYTSTSSGPSH
jgi:hypothetical protein